MRRGPIRSLLDIGAGCHGTPGVRPMRSDVRAALAARKFARIRRLAPRWLQQTMKGGFRASRSRDSPPAVRRGCPAVTGGEELRINGASNGRSMTEQAGRFMWTKKGLATAP